MGKRLFSTILCALLLGALTLPALADAPETLSITTREEFLTFGENCRLDTYSQGLTVTLEADIDLTGCDFAGIPLFSGSFDGKDHKISGLSLTQDGSMQGLFRHLTATAQVENLQLSAAVQPGGSQNQVGAFAGRNEGVIRNCRFTGTVSGGSYVGGIAGVNAPAAIIENCHTEGDIHGDHFVGGIAGENTGTIRNCTNKALVNTTPQQNSVEISQITMDTLTNAEAANTVTDIGGIAGFSSGVIRDCENRGNVGYRHIGYNIGGIAGSQSGYITGCENRGDVQGRKEVGGIVGQMEPAFLMSYSQDTLQILRGQLGTMNGLVNQASGNAQSNANSISTQIGVLKNQAQTAMDAANALLPDPKNPQVPDPDSVLAAQNTLSSAVSAMPDTVSGISAAAQDTVTGLTGDLNAISAQVNKMSSTLNSASETLGGAVTDVSDRDTPKLLTGKADSCANYGTVLADLNVGGIAGAMALENDLDILEDWQQSGQASLNFEGQVRAVLLECENHGTVTGKKQNVGGIVGWQALGLVKSCTNTGTADAADADYVGGISGRSSGFIRSAYAKCKLLGKTCVGGIAGSAGIVTDSLAQVMLTDAREKQGAILGVAEASQEEDPIARNYYLCVDKDYGAIDGISYDTLAQPLPLEDFMGLKDLPALFHTVTVRFSFEDGNTTQVTLTPGEDLDREKIPALPEKEGFTGIWEGLDDASMQDIFFDITFRAKYLAYSTTLESTQTRENGRPLLLVEGAFDSLATVEVAEAELSSVLRGREQLLETWKITLSQPGDRIRFLLPDGVDAQQVKLLTRDAQGNVAEVDVTREGSYLVFPVSQQEMTLALVETPRLGIAVYVIGAVAVLAAAGILVYRKVKATKKTEAV